VDSATQCSEITEGRTRDGRGANVEFFASEDGLAAGGDQGDSGAERASGQFINLPPGRGVPTR
jgi:hypothetical protein